MMEEKIIAYARIPLEVRPVAIYKSDPIEPIDADFVAIVVFWKDQNHFWGANVRIYNSSGRPVEELQFDTVEIAKDQAKAILGIPQDKWIKSDITSTEDGSITPPKFD